MYEGKENIKTPIPWYQRKNNYGDIPVLEFSQTTSKKVNESIKFVSSKKLLVYEDIQICAEVIGIRWDLEKIYFTGNHVSSVEELENLIIKSVPVVLQKNLLETRRHPSLF